jgi:ribosomal-protein-alanine N-acetyltransferase
MVTRTDQFIFTPMTEEDIEAVGTLEEQCFDDPWSRGTFRNELANNQLSFYWVLRPGPDAAATLPPILAYGGYWLMGDEAHIVNVATHPDLRRRGYGEITIMGMVEAAHRSGARLVTLEVRMSNRVAQKLYAKLGFVEVGERRRYYNDNGEDALLMTLFLESAPAQV